MKSQSCLMDPERAWKSTLMEIEGEIVKQQDIRSVSNKTEAVARATVQTGLGGDGGKDMTATAAAQAWIVIRRRQQQNNREYGGNTGGANYA